MNVYERNFKRLERLVGDLPAFLAREGEPRRIVRDPYMPLVVERTGPDRVSLAHYYEQNGDLMADPEMEIRVHAETGMAEALHYQQDGLGIFRRVYEERDGKIFVRPRQKKEQNTFLEQWLLNLKRQGFYN